MERCVDQRGLGWSVKNCVPQQIRIMESLYQSANYKTQIRNWVSIGWQLSSLIYSGVCDQTNVDQWVVIKIIHQEELSVTSDVYSIGCVLWECQTGKVPWDGYSRESVLLHVCKVNKISLVYSAYLRKIQVYD